MSVLDEMAASDPLFASELEGLTAEQRGWLEEELALRRKATALALELRLDESEVLHQLKQFRRPPLERLRLGLAHGRLRNRSAQ